MLAKCQRPLVVPAETVKDIARNSLARQSAWERCAVQVECLAAWYQLQRDEKPDRACGAFY